jgi:hypothetical protein
MRLTVAAAIFFTLKNRLSFTALFVDDAAAKKKGRQRIANLPCKTKEN